MSHRSGVASPCLSIFVFGLLALMPACGGGSSGTQTGPPPPTFKLIKLGTGTLTNPGAQHASWVLSISVLRQMEV